MPEKAEELHNMMKAWRKSIKAPVPTEKNPAYDAAAEAEALKKGVNSGKGKGKGKKKKK